MAVEVRAGSARGKIILCHVGGTVETLQWLGEYMGSVEVKQNHAKEVLTDNDFLAEDNPKDYLAIAHILENEARTQKYQATCVLSNITQLARLPDCQCGSFLITPCFLSLCNWTRCGGVLLALRAIRLSISQHVWVGVTPRPPPFQIRYNDRKSGGIAFSESLYLSPFNTDRNISIQWQQVSPVLLFNIIPS